MGGKDGYNWAFLISACDSAPTSINPPLDWKIIVMTVGGGGIRGGRFLLNKNTAAQGTYVTENK